MHTYNTISWMSNVVRFKNSYLFPKDHTHSKITQFTIDSLKKDMQTDAHFNQNLRLITPKPTREKESS